jgi:hypothetical protein
VVVVAAAAAVVVVVVVVIVEEVGGVEEEEVKEVEEEEEKLSDTLPDNSRGHYVTQKRYLVNIFRQKFTILQPSITAHRFG